MSTGRPKLDRVNLVDAQLDDLRRVADKLRRLHGRHHPDR